MMNFIEIIETAIIQKRVLAVRIKNNDFDINLEPYIQGDDFLQLPFVWGYIAFNDVYYKLHFDRIDTVKLTNRKFDVKENAVYHYAAQESHYSIVDDLEKMYR